MSVADLTLAAYAVLTVVSLFAAGRLWGLGAGAGRWRALGTLFAAAESVVLTYYLVWTDDRLHRAAYLVMNAAMGLVVLSAAALVLVAGRRRGRWGFLAGTALFSGVGIAAAAYTMAARDLFWPPFAVFTLALFLAPLLALGPRLRVRGYRPFRDQDFLSWVAVAVLGFWGVGETLSMVGLVPGTAWFGRPTLLHFFTTSTLVVTWLAGTSTQQPTTGVEIDPDKVPWQLFNPPLSPREADLVAGLGRRLTNKELAAETGVTESTVKKHLVSLFRKAGVTSRQELFERLDAARSSRWSETGPERVRPNGPRTLVVDRPSPHTDS